MSNLESDEPIIVINPEGSKVMVAAWGYLNKYIITGHEDGSISQYDWKVCWKLSFVLFKEMEYFKLLINA
jgi:translation initiation factor 3 subunit I